MHYAHLIGRIEVPKETRVCDECKRKELAFLMKELTYRGETFHLCFGCIKKYIKIAKDELDD